MIAAFFSDLRNRICLIETDFEQRRPGWREQFFKRGDNDTVIIKALLSGKQRLMGLEIGYVRRQLSEGRHIGRIGEDQVKAGAERIRPAVLRPIQQHKSGTISHSKPIGIIVGNLQGSGAGIYSPTNGLREFLQSR